jgi:glycine cleavage system H lipoate-binding protein
MIPHDILTLYGAKGLEYVIAISFLVLFVPFWRYAMGTRPAPEPAVVRAAQAVPAHSDLVEWFRVARDVVYHPGHAWARAAEAANAVLVGADDFAQKLVGPLRAIELPAPGTTVRQGEPAWRLHAGGKALEMLSPVDGVVTAVNRAVVDNPDLLRHDPYGTGWLLQVRSPRFAAQRKGLLSGRMAHRWVEDATNALRLRMSPDLGLAMQDGGVPVDGIAQALSPEDWERVAREFLLS